MWNFPAGRVRRAPHRLAAGLSTALLCAWASSAAAQDKQAEAAREFDAAVELFAQAEYEAAARAFLRADVLVPNSEAITNAMVAARRANDHMLVVQAAERGIQREVSDPGLAAKARQELAASMTHLVRLDVTCEPAPCELSLDGAPVSAGGRYVLPGTHRFEARAEGGAVTGETQTLAAGTTYRITLHVPQQKGEEQAAEVTATPMPGSQVEQPTTEAPRQTTTEAPRPPATPPEQDSGAALSPAWFYAGAAVTVGLGAVTLWSGIDTLNYDSDLGETGTQAERDKLEGKVLRSNLLFGATALAGLATGYLGLFAVDWSGGNAKTAVVPTGDGALLFTRGSF